MAEVRNRTRRQRVEEKERAIIAAAAEVFEANGFDRARIAEIAKRAGVAEGTVYLYFENKNALLTAVAADFYDHLTRDAADGIQGLDDTPAKLRFLARHHIERVAEEWQMLALAMTPFKASAEYRQTEGYQLNRTYVAVFDQVIRDGLNRGEIRDDVPLAVIRDIFYGGLEYAARTLRLRPEAADIDQVVDHFMMILAAGMFAQPALVVAETAASDAMETVLARLETVTAKLETTAG